MSKDGFFLEGDAPSRGYRNIRESMDGPGADGRKFVEELWPRYKGLADSHFRQDAQAHFQERFWEMYLGVTFVERGLAPIPLQGAGPEFFFRSAGRDFYVEAIAPGPGTGSDRVEEPSDGAAYSVPTEQVLLRLTHAVSEKRKKFLEARSAGICEPDSGYVLAVNVRGVPHAAFPYTLPYIVQALLPVGPPTLRIDLPSGKVVDSYYAHRDTVTKASGASVSTAAFLDSDYSCISAALSSSVDCVNRPASLGSDFVVVHNPKATVPLDRAVFSWCRQYVWNDYELQTITG